jgi:hypothetical protein
MDKGFSAGAVSKRLAYFALSGVFSDDWRLARQFPAPVFVP